MTDTTEPVWDQCFRCEKTERRARLEERHGVMLCESCCDSEDAPKLRKENAALREALVWAGVWASQHQATTLMDHVRTALERASAEKGAE